MDTAIVGGIFSVLGIVTFFGSIGLLMWIDQRGKAEGQRQQHEQRLRALELGRELPDAAVARAAASSSRAWAAALVGFFVPLMALGAGVGATALVLAQAAEGIHLALLCTIWGVAGLICIVAVATSLGAMHQPHPEEPTAAQDSTAIKATEPRRQARELDLEMAAHER
jgi:hypothetical protein